MIPLAVMLWLHCRVAVLPPREVRAPAPKVVELPRRRHADGYFGSSGLGLSASLYRYGPPR